MKRFLTHLLLVVFMLPLALQANQRGAESVFFFDFNDNSTEGWKTIDRDEDGQNWTLSEDGYIYSESSNDLKPNNIIATTEKYAIYATSKISFDVRPLSTENFAENYGIVYSEDGEFFYTIHNVTLESNEDWKNVEFSLDYCAGKEIYIGILHNSVESQSAILVDNVKLEDGKLPRVSNVVAEGNDDNAIITWNAPIENGTDELVGYRVFRVKEGNAEEMIANNLTETTYTDATWSEAEQGVYKFGVAALYSTGAKRELVTLLEEGFENAVYPNVPDNWTVYSDPESANSNGQWKANSNIGVYEAYNGEKAGFAMGFIEEGSNYYLVTPQIDFTKAMNPTLNFQYISPGWMGASSSITVAYSESATGPWTELWKYEGSDHSEWTAAEINLLEVSGRVAYLTFIATDNMGFGAGIDEIVITATASENALPISSDIVWSNNTVDKNMTRVVNFTVDTDNNASAAGATVSLTNVNDATYTYNATTDENGTCQFEEVRIGSYNYEVSLDGYYTETGQIEVEEDKNIVCTLRLKPEVIEGLYVSPTAWAMWEYENKEATFDILLNEEIIAENVSGNYYQIDVDLLERDEEYTTTVVPSDLENAMMEYTWTYSMCQEFATAANFKAEEVEGNAVLTWTMPTYEAPAEPVYNFSVNFDNGSMNGWTTIDADGDYYNWRNTSEFTSSAVGYESTHCVASMSYETELGKVLDPDNFLVSDQKYSITADSKLRWMVAAQSKHYPSEHYGIAISTKSNEKASDFEVIFEETLTAGEPEEGSIQSQWFERELDLSAYEGQRVYIAVRHYESSDNSWILVDNISLTSSTRGTAEDEEGEWLFYDNGVYSSAVGNYDYSSGSAQVSQVYWAIMFPADIISDYAGKVITKVSLYDNCAHKGYFSIHTGGDSSPGMSVHFQAYETTGSQQFVELELDTPVTVTGEENVWIKFTNEYGSGTYPAAYSEDTGDPNGRWRSDNDLYWYDSNWYGEGWYGTWMIRAFVTGAGIPDTPGITNVEPLGTIIYRNGELITSEPIEGETYTETIADIEQEYEYTIRVVYGGEKDETYYAMSCPLTTDLLVEKPMECVRPENLYGATTFNEDGTFGATLVWPYVKEWLYYDNGDVISAVGAGGNIYWGVKFPAEDLIPYVGSSLTKVALFDFEGQAGDAKLSISYGGDDAPGTTVHTQDVVFEGKGEMFELELSYPMPIGNENLWITLYQSGADYPAAVTEDTGDPNGRWCSLDGNAWGDLIEMSSSLKYTWFLRAYASNEAKGGQVFEIEKVKGEAGTEFQAITLDQPKTIVATREDAVLDHYNVYRSTTNGNYELIDETTDNKYFDEIEKGTYYYQVTAVYERDGETCESEPATSYDNPNENYVVVEVTTINENGVNGMMLYPNPTKDNLNITAESMKRISIINTLGQIVLDRNVNSDNTIIDMSEFEAGVYMVRITTENGVAVKRITVIK